MRLVPAATSVLVLASCSRPQPAPRPAAASVDSRLCAGCHAGIWKTYRETGMARAFSRASAGNVGIGALSHRASARDYRIARRGDRFVVERLAAGEFRDELEIHYVMGYGAAARSYLHLSPEGRLYELPIA